LVLTRKLPGLNRKRIGYSVAAMPAGVGKTVSGPAPPRRADRVAGSRRYFANDPLGTQFLLGL